VPEDTSSQVRVVQPRTSSDYFGVSYCETNQNFVYYFLGKHYSNTSEIEAAKSYDRLVLASGRKDYHLNFVWQLKK
jgi:hypothetical protein